ncbi:MAG: gfo/Idh/MocA family oxidoreductase [Firmicutes bacterium HGW-Firmicutes-21]|nr:MAG: gfo/Idh/MocA family oxidoreductase [Firmicutes bacterium HGW-Firmicutes-21]
MSKIKVAIIGCGTIANSAHIPAYIANADAEIKYFCDILPEKAKKAVEKYGCGIAVTDYKEILADPEVEAISVCTPNKMHSIITIDCLKAGKNVLCEKPAARIFSEAKAMQDAQHESGKVLNIGVVNRFNPAVNKLREMIQNGDLGEIYHVYACFRSQRSIPGLGGAFTTKEIAGGGVLIDWGVHYLDIVMYCTGDPTPRTVSSKAFSKLGVDMKNYVYEGMWAEDTKDINGTYDVDDFVTGFVRTDGPTITLNGAWAQNIGVAESYIDFIGTKAGARLNYGGDFTVYTTAAGGLVSLKPKFPQKQMFQEEIDGFLRCIRTGEKLPSHIDTVIVTAKMMQAMYDSSEQNKEIVL